jgi:hypothetical protein
MELIVQSFKKQDLYKIKLLTDLLILLFHNLYLRIVIIFKYLILFQKFKKIHQLLFIIDQKFYQNILKILIIKIIYI